MIFAWICFWFFFAAATCFFFLEEMLAVIHDPANRRNGISGNFHQIQFCFFCYSKRFINRDDANLLAVSTNQTDLTSRDILVDRGLGCSSLVLSHFTLNSYYSKSWRPRRETACASSCANCSRGMEPQIDAFAGAHSNGASLNLPIPDNQEIRSLEQSMLADFKADLLVSQVGLGTKPALTQGSFNFESKFGLLVGDVHHYRLSRCQPSREGSFVVLDQDTDEALE
ncbi:hypothetical protein SSTU70S_02732 [Stutzerimonas stutzeri]